MGMSPVQYNLSRVIKKPALDVSICRERCYLFAISPSARENSWLRCQIKVGQISLSSNNPTKRKMFLAELKSIFGN